MPADARLLREAAALLRQPDAEAVRPGRVPLQGELRRVLRRVGPRDGRERGLRASSACGASCRLLGLRPWRVARRRERLRRLAAVAVERDGLEAEPPALLVDLLRRPRPWPRWAGSPSCEMAPREEGLGRRHHLHVATSARGSACRSCRSGWRSRRPGSAPRAGAARPRWSCGRRWRRPPPRSRAREKPRCSSSEKPRACARSLRRRRGAS